MTEEEEVEFLFDSRGAVVAFRHGRDVFDLDLGWLGWAPWNDGDVYDPAGHYLGTITPEGRLYEIEVRRGLTSPPPPIPSVVSHPDPPRACASEPLAAGMQDIRPRQLVRPHELSAAVAADGDAALISYPVRRGLPSGSPGRTSAGRHGAKDRAKGLSQSDGDRRTGRYRGRTIGPSRRRN